MIWVVVVHYSMLPEKRTTQSSRDVQRRVRCTRPYTSDSLQTHDDCAHKNMGNFCLGQHTHRGFVTWPLRVASNYTNVHSATEVTVKGASFLAQKNRQEIRDSLRPSLCILEVDVTFNDVGAFESVSRVVSTSPYMPTP